MRGSRFAFAALICLSCAGAAEPSRDVPGVVIHHSPASTRAYVGSPSLAILPDGRYVASHDLFGPGSKANTTLVYGSEDRGRSWKSLATVQHQFWSTLFVHHGALYLLGTHPGNVSIRRSCDGGKSWTEPQDATCGLLTSSGHHHCAPVPIVVHHGRVWRAMEQSSLAGFAGLKPLMMSAPADSDLLNAANWSFSDALSHQPQWLAGNEFRGWLEGNAVVDPNGAVVNVLRVHTFLAEERAAVIHYSPDGKTSRFNPSGDIIEFPGGAKKFTIRRDPHDGSYWALVNWVPEQFRDAHPANNRNTLALSSSPDLRNWSVRTILLQHADPQHCGYQYADWQFDGDDIVAVVRTADEDGCGGAHNFHDANFLTFHRITQFRSKTMADSPPMAGPPLLKVETQDYLLTGHGWTLAPFAEGELAFANRRYVWKGVPAPFRGGLVTRANGGERASIRVTAKRAATLYLATTAAQRVLDLRGWAPVAGSDFAYSDKGETTMTIYRREAKPGEEVRLPQGNWTGGLLLIPPEPASPAFPHS